MPGEYGIALFRPIVWQPVQRRLPFARRIDHKRSLRRFYPRQPARIAHRARSLRRGKGVITTGINDGQT